MTVNTDICIIGAGAGGLSVAAGAVQMGAKVTLIEAGEMGGDCLNTGCVPSKALLGAAKAAARIKKGGPAVDALDPNVDFSAAQTHVKSVIAEIAPHDSQERFEELGCTVLRGFAKFTSHKTIEVNGETITARRFVIATGSRPAIPPIPGLAHIDYHTNETIFDIESCPDHLIIIGAGPIGTEMAQAHQRLGAKVTLIEEADRILPREDSDAADLAAAQLRADGATLMTGARVTKVEKIAAGSGIQVDTSKGSIEGSHLLIATGRKVNLDNMDLHKGQIEHSPKGVTVDSGLRSPSNRRVYAIGDVAGGAQFTHVAGYHAGIIIRPMLLGLPASARADHIPRVTYIDPELAQIGPTEAEARATYGNALAVMRQDYANNDRARAEGTTAGFIKLMVVKGRPVGATIYGAQAGELISMWSMAIANNMKLSQISATILPYPTLSELNKRAAGAYFSPKLFENPWVKRVVRIVQKILP